MRRDILVYAIAAALVLTILPAEAVQSSGTINDKFEQWQLRRLFDPNEHQLRQGRAGMVFIYDGIKSNIINRVMDEQFDCLDSMMFTRTIITDDYGEPEVDPQTGLAMIEDDGC